MLKKDVWTKDKIQRIFLFSFVFLLALAINYNVDFSSDDFAYKQVAVCGINEIVQFMKWHINNYNGRTLVHLAAMFFLRNNIGVMLWKIICSVTVSLTLALIGKIGASNPKVYFKEYAVATVLFLIINPAVFNESIYWLTGSFNYLFPTFLILILFRVTRSCPDSKWLFLLSLVSGATTEQTGMMTIGLFVLLLADELIQSKKINIRHVICLGLSIAGYLTVILSPGTFRRVDTQNSLTFKTAIGHLIITLKDFWFGNINMLVLLIPIAVLSSVWIYKYRNQNAFVSKFYKLILVVFWILNGFNLAIKAISLLDVMDMFIQKINIIIFIVWIAYVIVFFATVILASLLVYVAQKDSFLFATVIIAFGSVCMMCVSNKTFFRNCLPMILTLLAHIIFSVSRLSETLIIKMDKKSRVSNFLYKKSTKVVAAVLVLMLGIVNVAWSVENLVAGPATAGSLKDRDPSSIVKLNSDELQVFIDEIEFGYQSYFANPDVWWNFKQDPMDFSDY